LSYRRLVNTDSSTRRLQAAGAGQKREENPGRALWYLSFTEPSATAAWMERFFSPTAVTGTETMPISPNVVPLVRSGKRLVEEQVRCPDRGHELEISNTDPQSPKYPTARVLEPCRASGCPPLTSALAPGQTAVAGPASPLASDGP